MSDFQQSVLMWVSLQTLVNTFSIMFLMRQHDKNKRKP
jgi:hypothetical protein